MVKGVLPQFIEWHFYEMPQKILKGWLDFLKFSLNYFSIPLLLKTFFSPWHRYYYSYGRGFDFKRFFETLSFNALARGIGALVRSILIAIGLICEVFIIIAGLILFLGWLALPALLIVGAALGLKLIFFI